MDYLSILLISNIIVIVFADHDTKHKLWKRNTTSTVDLEIGFTITKPNIGECSIYCDGFTGCESFTFDPYSVICTGYLLNTGQNLITFTDTQWYFTRYSGGGNIQIYNEAAYSFTNCGTTGPTGPTLTACRAAYNTQWSQDINVFNVSNSGVQHFKITQTGIYRIEVYGASGGYGDTVLGTNSGSFLAGGRGAKIQGSFNLAAGTILNIVCGQMGSNGTWSEAGGGGGGSFVYTGSIGGNGLLIAAGGGGGAGEESTSDGFDGQSGEQAQNQNGLVGSDISQNGGKGYGGIGGTVLSAGAGWYSDGASMTGSNDANPGTRWNGGNEISVSYNPSNLISGAGGFGGGGSGCESNGGGSGGGYTGGSGGDTNMGGSGGGSYNSGTDQSNVTGYNDGHGYVNISPL